MVREPLDLFGQAIGSALFDGLHNLGMQDAPPLLQEAPVGHLVGEGVLEGAFALGEEPRLIEKLGGLQVGKATLERRLGQLSNGLRSSSKGTSVPITAAVWRRRFSSGGNRSIRAASTACTVAGTWMVGRACPRR